MGNMSLVKFLMSKTFFKQVALAIVATVVIVFLALMWLDSTTNNGEFKTVPSLTGKSLKVAEIELNKESLVLVVQDSANYNPKYPRFSVIEQDPISGNKVKENRKIYVTLNPSGYRKVLVPDLKQRTLRQAKPALEALGFKIGKLTYVNNIAKDVVLGMEFKGKPIAPNKRLPKTTVIDLVLGNGKRPGNLSTTETP